MNTESVGNNLNIAYLEKDESNNLTTDKQTRKAIRCKEFEYSDTGNAKRLIHRYGNDLLYSFLERKWLIWDEKRYRRDDTGAIYKFAKDTVLRIADEGKISDNPDKVFKFAASSQNSNRINGMINLARNEVAILPDDLDADTNLLNLQNCTLNLKTLEPQAHSREDKITRVCGCNYIPDAKCPIFEKFVSSILGGNERLIRFLQRLLGYCLLGDPAERVLPLLYGPGGNGKSTLNGCISDLFGDYAVNTPSESFLTSKNDRVRNDLARMKGARFVSANETTKGRRLDESIIKLLTGYQDKITARYLHKEYFEYRPQFVLFWSFNSKPIIKDNTQSLWDRVLLFPFIIIIPLEERDHRLPEKLKAELSGILNWMIQGLQEYRKIGLAIPDEIKAATEEYRKEEDYLEDFLQSRVIQGPEYNEYFIELFVECCKFCDETGRDPPTKKNFGTDLKARFTPDKDKLGRYYKGLKLKNRQDLSEEKISTMISS